MHKDVARAAETGPARLNTLQERSYNLWSRP